MLYSTHSRRRPSRHTSRTRRYSQRQLRVEPLEERRLLATFVVNSTSGVGDSFLGDGICDTAHNPLTDPPTPASGVCTLRAASEQASSSTDSDRIEFDVPVGAGVVPVFAGDAFIHQGSAEIDGSTQPAGRVSVRGVTIAGTGGSLVKGLVVRDGGINIASSSNTVVGSYIGIDAGGTAAVSSLGIRIQGDGNLIGGTNPADRNLFTMITVDGDHNTIVGNYVGLDVTGNVGLTPGLISIDNGSQNAVGGETPAHGNVVHGTIRVAGLANNQNRSPSQTLIKNNLIGTNRDGTAAIAHPGPGIQLVQSDENAIVANTIASAIGPPAFGGGASGIFIGAGVDRTSIEGNKIGTDISGTITDPDGTPGTGDEFGNKDFGIVIDGEGLGASGNTIGGATADKANVVSGNGTGIRIGNRADGNVVVGNYVGSDAAGATALANGIGIEILFAGSNVIGGARPNVVSGNAGVGIVIAGATAIDNLVAGNRIGTNEAGNAPIPNEHGIVINDAPNNCIGGVIPSGAGAGTSDLCSETNGTFVGNVVSGNEKFGIQIANSNAHGNRIRANVIGTDVAGATNDPDGIPGTGDELGNGWDGVAIMGGADDNVVGGDKPGHRNIISGNDGDGVLIIGIDGNDAERNVVIGNYIGVDSAGTGPIGNGFRGVHIDGHTTQNVIGGVKPNERNIISGNRSDGILIFSATARGNTIKNNFVGTDAAGTTAVANVGNGIYLWDAPDNAVGVIEQTSVVGNVVSGNELAGVRIEGAEATRNVLVGNSIGADTSRRKALGNEEAGIEIVDAPLNVIGGAASGNPLAPTYPGNVVSGNRGPGIRISGSGAESNFLGANLIGTDNSGNEQLANLDHGIHILGAPNTRIGQSLDGEPSLSGNTVSNNADGIRIEQSEANGTIIGGNKIGTKYDGTREDSAFVFGNSLIGVHLRDVSDTLIGGVAFDGSGGAVQLEPNIIADNLRGVRIEGASAEFNTVQRNSIYGNRREAIDLGNDGTTPNDPLDLDSGPNTLLNAPIVQGLSEDLKLSVSYDGAPNKTLTLDVYQSDSEAGDGGGQAQTWVKEVDVTTDANGKAEVDIPIAFDSAHPFLTVTATDTAGNTSEFSGPLRMPDLTVDPFSLFPNDVIRRGGSYIIPYTVTVRNVGTAPATEAVVRITGNGVPLGMSGSGVSLEPAESIDISGEWDVTSILTSRERGVGTVELAAVVDPADLIAELPVAANRRSASADLDGRPVIVRLEKEFAEGVFLEGVSLDNQIDVYVDWNGNLDGIAIRPSDQPRVFVQLHGVEQPPMGDTSLVESVPTSFVFDIGSDFLPGTNAIDILAELRGVGFESPKQTLQYDLAATVPWITTALWTVDADGGPLEKVAVYSAGVTFPDVATEGAFGVPVDKVGFAGGTFGSSLPPTTIQAKVRSDGASQLTGTLKMGTEVGGDETGGAEAAISASVTGGFSFDPGLSLDQLGGMLTGELAATTPKIPFPVPASFLRAQGKIGLGVSATLSIVDEDGALQWPSDLIIGLEPSLEAIVSVGAGPASVEAGAGGSIHGDFSLAGDPCVPLGGEVAVFLRVAASFLVFEAEKTFSFPFTLPACGGGGASEGEPRLADWVSVFSDVHPAPRYPSTVYGPIEGEDSSNGPPVILYPFADPSLARNDDGTMTLVFVGEDPARPTGQQLEIFASHFDGIHWSVPALLTDDTLLDSAPSVSYDSSGNAVAVWSRVKTTVTDVAGTDPASLLDDMEIVYAVRNAADGTWSAPATLTDNTAMDYLPTLQTGSDGTVMAAWLYDPASDTPIFPDDTTPLGAEYRYALWDGSNWSAPATAVSSVATNEAPALALGDGEATLVWSEDGDGDATTSSDRDVRAVTWDGTTWSAPITLSSTSDGLADLTPRVIYTSGNRAHVTWVRTGVPLSEAEADVTDELVEVQQNPSGFSSPQIAVVAESISALALTLADDGNVLAVWSDRSATGPDLFYAKADASAGDWSESIQLTDTTQLEWQLNPYIDGNGDLQVLFLERSVGRTPFGGNTGGEGETHNTVPIFVGSSLHQANRKLGFDLEVRDLEILGQPTPGSSVQVRATVRNAGDRNAPAASVALFQDGTASGAPLTAPPLASGEQSPVTFDWTVPTSPPAPVTLEVKVDPFDALAESDESNNRVSIVTLQPDLVVSSVQAFHENGRIRVSATVENIGPTSTGRPTGVSLRLDNPDSQSEIGTATVLDLAPGASADVAIFVEQPAATLTTFRRGYIVTDSQAAVSESDESNNSALVALNPYDSWQNPTLQFDVNNDGVVTPLDVLLLITDLDENDARRLPVIPMPPQFVDASGDHTVSPIDVLFVLSFLTRESDGEEEGDGALSIRDELFSEPVDWRSHLANGKPPSCFVAP